MTKRHFFIISPVENEDQEVMVELTETITENTSTFSFNVLEGKSTISDELLGLILSEIAMTYVSGEGVHTEYMGMTEYDFVYNLGKVISESQPRS